MKPSPSRSPYLIAHGIVDRPTDDVDLFSNQEAGVSAAAEVVQDALRAAGFLAERQDPDRGLADVFYGMGDGIAEWVITAPGGQQTMLQLAYFDRSHRPVTMDVGPVLALEDLAGSKVCALASQVEPRDYIDTAAAMRRYPVEQLIGFAKRLDHGLEDRDFADAGRQLDRMPDGVFARYGLSPADVARLREQFRAWPRS